MKVNVNIKIRNVEIKDLSMKEIRELRDLLDDIVGKRDIDYVPYPCPVYPAYPERPWYPYWVVTTTPTTSGSSFTSGGSCSGKDTVTYNITYAGSST